MNMRQIWDTCITLTAGWSCGGASRQDIARRLIVWLYHCNDTPKTSIITMWYTNGYFVSHLQIHLQSRIARGGTRVFCRVDAPDRVPESTSQHPVAGVRLTEAIRRSPNIPSQHAAFPTRYSKALLKHTTQYSACQRLAREAPPDSRARFPIPSKPNFHTRLPRQFPRLIPL